MPGDLQDGAQFRLLSIGARSMGAMTYRNTENEPCTWQIGTFRTNSDNTHPSQSGRKSITQPSRRITPPLTSFSQRPPVS